MTYPYPARPRSHTSDEVTVLDGVLTVRYTGVRAFRQLLAQKDIERDDERAAAGLELYATALEPNLIHAALRALEQLVRDRDTGWSDLRGERKPEPSARCPRCGRPCSWC